MLAECRRAAFAGRFHDQRTLLRYHIGRALPLLGLNHLSQNRGPLAVPDPQGRAPTNTKTEGNRMSKETIRVAVFIPGCVDPAFTEIENTQPGINTATRIVSFD